MKVLYHIFILMFIIGANTAYSQTLPEQFKEKVASQTSWIDGSHQIDYEGNDFIINITNKKLTSLRAPIFHDNMYENISRNILNYIEEAYANYLLNANDSRFNDFYFKKGSWKNLKTFNKNTSFTLSNNNSQSYTATWNTNDSIVILTFPVGYDKTNKGTRSEIENRYIDGLKHFIVKAPRHIPHTTISDLKQTKDSIYVLPGNTYVINSVSNDSYFTINKKKNQTENWMRRPIDDQMLNYALKDVEYLFDLKDALLSEVEKRKLLRQVNQAMKHVADIKPQKPGWMKICNVYSLSKNERIYLKHIFNAREKIAERFNTPAVNVLKKSDVLKLAKLSPLNEEDVTKFLSVAPLRYRRFLIPSVMNAMERAKEDARQVKADV